MKKLFLAFAALMLMAAGRAQQMDNPVNVPVTFYALATSGGGTTDYEFTLTNPVAITSNDSQGGTQMYSHLQTANLVPGKTYLVSYVVNGCSGLQFTFPATPNQTIYINGAKQSGYVPPTGAGGTFTVRVEAINDLTQGLAGKRGGECAAFPEDKPIWYIGLGSMRSGNFAGAVGFREASISASTDLFTPAALIYDTIDESEVTVSRDSNGYITQIQSRDVILKVDSYVSGSTSYNINVFSTSNPSTAFLTYKISQYAVTNGAGIRIDKTEDGVTWSTALAQVGSSWTRYDWQIVPVGGTFDVTHTAATTTTTVNNQPVETVSYGGGITVKTKAFLNGELASATMGPALTVPETTSYLYYYDNTGTGWPGSVQSSTDPSGNWLKYDYYNTDQDSRAGQIQYLYRPWLDTPSTPGGATLTSGYVEAYAYSTNYDGNQTAISSKVVTINGTQVGKTTWTYNWNTGTVNGHTIAQKTEQDYASSAGYLSTTTQMYRPDDSQIYFSDKLHSVSYPDGRKDSYAYIAGTWNASSDTFSGDSSGNDRMTIVFHGQQSGGTAYTAWTIGNVTWSIDSVSLVKNYSTASVAVIDTMGHTVFVGTDVYDGTTALQAIAGTVYTYDTHGRISQEQDLERPSVTTTHTYATSTQPGKPPFTETITAPDGVEIERQYDSFFRLSATITGATGTGNYPAKTQQTVYDAADQPTKTYTCGCQTSPVTFNYDTAGRVTDKYEKSPNDADDNNAGTLHTQYLYPSTTSTETILPTGATKTVSNYPDGHAQSITGSAQPPEQWSYAVNTTGIATTHQNGTSADNGWIQDQADYLGRVVTHSAPTYGYSGSGNPSNVIDVTSTYDSSTGLLNAQTTTYRATNAKLLPDHLYMYDGAGMLTSDGLDVDKTGSLEAKGTDRITTHGRTFQEASSIWSQVATTGTYASANLDTATTLSTVSTQLTGFGSGVVGLVTTTDVNGRTTTETTTIDSTNLIDTKTVQVSGIANAAVQITKNGYDYQTQDFAGQIVQKDYDGFGRLSHVKSRSQGTLSAPVFDATDTYTYYHSTTFVDTQTVAGVTSTFSYDWNASNNTRRVFVTDANGNVSYTRYNAMDLPDHTGGAATSAVAYGYDSFGRKTSITTYRAGGPYDESNWPTTGDTTTWTLDAATGLVTSKTYADGNAVGSTYTALGQLSKRTWAQGTTATYTYNDGVNPRPATEELASVSYSDGSSVSYTYNRSGTIATAADSTTGTHTFNYTNANNPFQLSSEDFSGFYSASGATARRLTQTYDSSGQPTGFTLGTASASASDLTQFLGISATSGLVNYVNTTRGAGITQQFSYNYNKSDTALPTGYTMGGFAAVFDYDSSSATRRTHVVGQWNGASLTQFDIVYDALGRVLSSQQSGTAFNDYYGGAGYSSVYNYHFYDSRSQLTTRIMYRNAPPTSGVPASADELPGRRYEFRYDQAGNRTTAGNADPSGSGAGIDETYTANLLNQYTKKDTKTVHVLGTAAVSSTVSVTTTTVTKLDRNFAADLVPSANPSTGTVTISAAMTVNNSPVASQQTRSWQVAPNPQSFSYDNDGNLTDDGIWGYGYDCENRLVSMTRDSAAVTAGFSNQKIEFAYDYLNRRVMKRVSNWSGSAWIPSSERHYLYEGWNLVAEFELLPNFSLVRSYTWGLDVSGSLTATSGVGALLQIHDYGTGNDYMPAYDGNANVTALVDDTGLVEETFEYTPFGQLTRAEVNSNLSAPAQAAVASQPFGYSTKFTDSESGLVYYGLRYYSPKLGRFINRDPIEESGGANLYAFVLNSPAATWDILGMFPDPTTDSAGNPGCRSYTYPLPDGSFGVSIQCGPLGAGYLQVEPDPPPGVPRHPPPPIIDPGNATTTPPFVPPSRRPGAPNSSDCAKLKAQLKQASEIRDRNLGSFNKGGTYEGYLPEGLTTEEKVGLGALIAGVGNGGFGLVVDNLAAKNGRTLAAYGAQYFNRVSPGFAQTVGRFGLGLSGVGFVFDAKGLVEASNSGNEAATALGVFNVSADAVAVALGGPVGVGIGAAQIGLNVYALQQDRIYRRETKANANVALTNIALAQAKLDSVKQQLSEKGCK